VKPIPQQLPYRAARAEGADSRWVGQGEPVFLPAGAFPTSCSRKERDPVLAVLRFLDSKRRQRRPYLLVFVRPASSRFFSSMNVVSTLHGPATPPEGVSTMDKGCSVVLSPPLHDRPSTHARHQERLFVTSSRKDSIGATVRRSPSTPPMEFSPLSRRRCASSVRPRSNELRARPWARRASAPPPRVDNAFSCEPAPATTCVRTRNPDSLRLSAAAGHGPSGMRPRPVKNLLLILLLPCFRLWEKPPLTPLLRIVKRRSSGGGPCKGVKVPLAVH
jgi:hypothetical protein